MPAAPGGGLGQHPRLNLVTYIRVERGSAVLIPSTPLRGVLGQFGQMLAMAFRRSDDLHLLPVIRKFSAAIETGHIGSGQRCSLRTARCSANRDRKAVAGVPAAEKSVQQSGNTAEEKVDQSGNHDSPSTSTSWLARSWVTSYNQDNPSPRTRPPALSRSVQVIPLVKLDSGIDKTVSAFVRPACQTRNTPRNPCTGYSYSRRENVSPTHFQRLFRRYTLCGPRFFCCWHLVMMADRSRPRRSSGNS